jgi:two-component system, NtrC family, response regulator GlrR
VLARAIHSTSNRADGPFVTIDCGALPPGVIESELFGHEKGAFTGAAASRRGAFEEASGGTLFLDEIGEIALDLQPKLLRALEQREVRPVGSNRTRPFDIRVVAATNRRLAECVQQGTFRQDLYYRLAIARVVVPPLRDRPDDIPSLAQSFLQTITGNPTATLPPDLAGMLKGYSWPGNVRELRNVIQRYAHLGITDRGQLFDSAPGAPTDLSELPYHEARRITVESFERGYVTRVLERVGGVVTRAAEEAQIGRATFYRMLERLQLPGAREDDDR